MSRGRKKQTTKSPSKQERLENLEKRILSLPGDLRNRGFGDLLVVPDKPTPIGEAEHDPKTEGYIVHAKEPLGTYIQRVSVLDNFSQRPPFDHANDPIYRRLIKDFMIGAVMPESKVAALSSSSVVDGKVESIEKAENIRYSVIDGLQRLYCYCIALLLVLYREELVSQGCFPEDVWETYFKEFIACKGDSRSVTESLLKLPVRYELFYNINLSGLLHYMVTFNTAQRRMSLDVQLEIMRRPLIDALQNEGIPVVEEIASKPGQKRDKEKFDAADLVLAVEAFMTNNEQVSAKEQTVTFMEKNERYLEDIGDIKDVLKTIKRLTVDVHKKMQEVYFDDPNKKYILSAGCVFLIALAAACGFIRSRNNMKTLEGSLEKLESLLDTQKEDPLNLEEYYDALSEISSNRGKSIRRLVYNTFRLFFQGATTRLEWLDTYKSL